MGLDQILARAQTSKIDQNWQLELDCSQNCLTEPDQDQITGSPNLTWARIVARPNPTEDAETDKC